MNGIVWHLSTAYNPEGWSVACQTDRRTNDRRTFAVEDVTCEACRKKLAGSLLRAGVSL